MLREQLLSEGAVILSANERRPEYGQAIRHIHLGRLAYPSTRESELIHSG